MTERQDRLASEREEIASRIARFKATQEKFAREREEYAAATMESVLNRAPRWLTQKSARTG
jgi:chorismate mutase